MILILTKLKIITKNILKIVILLYVKSFFVSLLNYNNFGYFLQISYICSLLDINVYVVMLWIIINFKYHVQGISYRNVIDIL